MRFPFRSRLLLAATASLLAAACSSSSAAPPAPDAGPAAVVGGPPYGPHSWNVTVTPPNDAAAAAGRLACAYKAGALPAETQGESTPLWNQIPVDHILVVMMENRSFDHYMQKAPAAGIDVDVAPATFSNPDPAGTAVPIFHQPQYCFPDTAHDWDSVHEEIDSGKMDGFVKANNDTNPADIPPHGTAAMILGNRAVGYYDQTDIPYAYWVAQNFAIGDRYFASVPGPTYPNRSYLYAATSFGNTANSVYSTTGDILFDRLEDREVSWKVYTVSTPGFAFIIGKYLMYDGSNGGVSHVVPISEYYADAAAGTLPQVAFIDPDLANESYMMGPNDPSGGDEHPPGDMQIGEQWAAKVVSALATSPNWSSSALFFTYDEHGGLFDHVPPPPACVPDDIKTQTTAAYPTATFNEYGVRVPFMVISPFAKKGYVGHDVYDHTSIVRFIEARFAIPALTNRDANALVPWDMFDFANPPNATPPTVPIPAIDETQVAACVKIFTP
jgi:phospholipase C